MDRHALFANYLNNHPEAIGKVVDFVADHDPLYHFVLTAANKEITAGGNNKPW